MEVEGRVRTGVAEEVEITASIIFIPFDACVTYGKQKRLCGQKNKEKMKLKADIFW